MNILQEMAFAPVSAQVSAGDGQIVDTMTFQPPASAASNLQQTVAELFRRMFTHVLSPSATLISGGSAPAVALTIATAGPSGIWGLCQGQPFFFSAAANAFSGSPTSAISTTSAQIRKVLVCLDVSGFGGSGPAASSLTLSAVSSILKFVYGSAMATSALACTSGGQFSYFDLVPLPLPNENQVPVGWLNIVNSFNSGTGLAASHMFSDYRVFQGYNLSAIFPTRAQP